MPASTSTTGSAGASTALVGGTHVPAGDALSAADAARLATEVNGRWLGSWHDTAGGDGTGEVSIALDPRARTVKATISFAGPLLGSMVASQTYQIDLLSFTLAADSYQVTSPQFGKLTIVPGGATSATATATAIPAHPEIAGIDIRASRTGPRVDISYTIRGVDGAVVNGTMAWGNGTRASAAPLPTPGAAPSPTDVQSGTYAAGLLTAKALTSIFGTTFPAPSANGGRLSYQEGIDTSNARSTGAELDLEYTVYVGHSAAATTAFWRSQLRSQPAVDGPWRAAFWYDEIATLYVYATDTRALTVTVVPLAATGGPSAAMREKLCKAVANQLVAAFKST